MESTSCCVASASDSRLGKRRITSYNVCYTKLLRNIKKALKTDPCQHRKLLRRMSNGHSAAGFYGSKTRNARLTALRTGGNSCSRPLPREYSPRITSYNVCYTKLLRSGFRRGYLRAGARQKCERGRCDWQAGSFCVTSIWEPSAVDREGVHPANMARATRRAGLKSIFPSYNFV